jgi:hypothetical protein
MSTDDASESMRLLPTGILNSGMFFILYYDHVG